MAVEVLLLQLRAGFNVFPMEERAVPGLLLKLASALRVFFGADALKQRLDRARE